MKHIQTSIIPAHKGYRVVYKEGNDAFVDNTHVIAWKIEVFSRENEGTISVITPISIDGEPALNWIGIQNPDLTVTEPGGSHYSSIEHLLSTIKRAADASQRHRSPGGCRQGYQMNTNDNQAASAPVHRLVGQTS